MSTRIQFEKWEELYVPLINPNNPNEEIFFETFGEDFDFVRKADSNKVWTEVENDFGDLVILSGFHFVNRMRHYITTLPFKEDLEVSDIEYISREESINICLELNKELNLKYPEELIMKYYMGDGDISVSKAEHIAITLFEENGSISDSNMLKINNHYSMLK